MTFVVLLRPPVNFGGPAGLPIHGPPAPVPQDALVVGSIMNINMVYQFVSSDGIILDSGAGSWPFDFLGVKNNSATVFFAFYFGIIGLVHLLAWRQRRNLPDWRARRTLHKALP